MKKGKSGGKIKLTVTADKDVLERAKKISGEKHILLSGAIEKFLEFFTTPKVYRFKCGERFSSTESEVCPKCG